MYDKHVLLYQTPLYIPPNEDFGITFVTCVFKHFIAPAQLQQHRNI